MVVLAATWGCSATYPTAPEPTIAAVKIHVSAPVWELVPNSTASFVAYEIDSNGLYTDVTSQADWSTSDPGVLSTTLDRNRRIVRAVSPGDANLIVSHGGRTDSVSLRVQRSSQSAPHIELEGGTSLPAINPTRTTTLTVQVRSFSSTGLSQVVTSAALITTSDPNVAIVDRATIRPVSPGMFRIIATYNGMTAIALASVSPAQAPPP